MFDDDQARTDVADDENAGSSCFERDRAAGGQDKVLVVGIDAAGGHNLCGIRRAAPLRSILTNELG